MVLCAACKSFFYRATKNLRGKGYAGDQLKDPEVHARHLQDASRYAKCLGVGMRPMLVLDRLKKGNSHAQQRYIAATTPKAPMTPPRSSPASPSRRRPRADSQPLTGGASPRPQKRARKTAPRSRPVVRSRRTRTRTAKASAACATEDNEADIVACKAADESTPATAPVADNGLASTSPSLATSSVAVSDKRASPVASVAIPVAEITAANTAPSPQRACVSQLLQWPVEADIDDEAAMEEWDMSFITADAGAATGVGAVHVEPAVDLSFPLDVKVFDAPAPVAMPTVPTFDTGYACAMPAAATNYHAAMSLMFRHFVAAGGMAGAPATGNHMGAFHLLPFAGVPLSCGMPIAPPAMGSFMSSAAEVASGPAEHNSDLHPF